MSLRLVFLGILLPLGTAYGMYVKPVSLKNIQNSCFMNAPIQALFSMNALNELVSKNRSNYQPGSFALEYNNLQEMAQLNPGMSIAPTQLCIKGRGLLAGAGQATEEDAGEFLQAALNSLSYKDMKKEALAKSDVGFFFGSSQRDTDIAKLYWINMITQITRNDGVVDLLPEGNSALLLPVKEQYGNLYDGLEDYFKEESVVLEGIPSKKKTFIQELGRYVIIQLNRAAAGNRRIEHAFKINPKLFFKAFIKDYSPSKYIEDFFNLKAVVLHKTYRRGTSGTGHYIAYVKRSRGPNDVGDWFKCDDSSISKVRDSDEIKSILQKGHGKDDEALLPTILIYERDLVEPLKDERKHKSISSSQTTALTQ